MRRIKNILSIIGTKIRSVIGKIKDFFRAIRYNSQLWEQVKKLVNVMESQYKLTEELQKENESLKRGQQLLHERLLDIETFMETAKTLVKEKVRNTELDKKRKWLNGYPDETGGEE